MLTKDRNANIGFFPLKEIQHDNGYSDNISQDRRDGLVQERRNSSALAMELRLFCTEPSIVHLMYRKL